MPLELEYRGGGLHLPRLGLWLDPHEAQLGPERVFVSHAHSDHVAAHREIILSAPTAKLMEARLPGVRHEHVLEFRQPNHFEYDGTAFSLTLLPAGHIFGSAMALVQAREKKLLFTGDFKLRSSWSAEACEPRLADILVMETTFGRPEYVFPPTEAVLEGVVRFCREALDNEETPVLLGYSLGKSQELLCSLGDAKLPIMLHGSVFRLTQIYEEFGQCFPPYQRYEAGAARGKVLLCPPNVINSAMLRNLGRTRAAIVTGWAVDPNCPFRYQCDAAFPLSDHADFPDLLELVKRVQPKKIYTVHGFAAEFAQTLRDTGYDAQALSEHEQFALPLGEDSPKSKVQGRESAVHGPQSNVLESELGFQNPKSKVGRSQSSTPQSALTSDSFLRFAETCAAIGATSSKLEKVRLLAEYLRSLKSEGVRLAATWFTGRPFPAAQNKVMQVGWAVLRDTMCAVGQLDEALLHQVYLRYSDLGETVAEVLRHRGVACSLTLKEVAAIFVRMQAARGPRAKTELFGEALERCSAPEAKYLVKILTGDLRIGLKEGLVEEAVAVAFSQTPEALRQANLLLGDMGETAKLAAENRLSHASMVPFQPVKFMLASPEQTATDIWERVQSRLTSRNTSSCDGQPPTASADGRAGPPSVGEPAPVRKRREVTVWLEDKYDGIRCQLHKLGSRVALYSRDLKEMAGTFPDIADGMRRLQSDFIMDGEIVAMRGSDVLPFAELQKRLGRHEPDLFMREEVPVKYVAFDLLWAAGAMLLEKPLRERRERLIALAPSPPCLVLSQITQAASVADIEAAFEAARARGNEGLMIKDPESAYAPGRRGLAWLKLKRPFATLDCVVIGAEYGHGKRSQVLSDYTFAVRDEQSGQLKTIGKAYTGLTDAEIADLTQHFLKTATRQHGRYFEVPPDTILEIAFDRLQASQRHSSGLAMRFPRIVRIRTDKAVDEIDTLAGARRIAERLGKPSEND